MYFFNCLFVCFSFLVFLFLLFSFLRPRVKMCLILLRSMVLIVQLSHPHISPGNTGALTMHTFVDERSKNYLNYLGGGRRRARGAGGAVPMTLGGEGFTRRGPVTSHSLLNLFSGHSGALKDGIVCAICCHLRHFHEFILQPTLIEEG